MGKRSDFKRRKQDAYDTPKEAVPSLLPHIGHITHYIEPCAGDGTLVTHLAAHGKECVDATDIAPRSDLVDAIDMFDNQWLGDWPVITNPPWTREILHPMIDMFVEEGRDIWLIFDADWAYTKQATPYLRYCHTIQAVPRLKWIEGTSHAGKDNCAWYGFRAGNQETRFYGRA